MEVSTDLKIDLGRLDSPERLRIAAELLPDPAIDDVLQAIVAEASEMSEFPVAIVSIVVRRIQFFRASVGLPEPLASLRATDRCVSFCQHVVASGEPLAISTPEELAKMPQELVQRFGLQAYVGMPLQIGNQIVGTLCVLDLQPNALSEEQMLSLRLLADQAEVRLEALVSESVRARRHLYRAVQPAFGELRNIFQILYWDLENTRIAALEIEQLRSLVELASAGTLDARALKDAAGVLKESRAALDDMQELVDSLQEASERASRMFGVLEKSLEERTTATVGIAQAIQTASGLAEHYTRSRGGVTWGELPAVTQGRARPAELIAVLSLALRGLADRLQSPGIEGSVTTGDGVVSITIKADVDAPDIARVIEELRMVNAQRVVLEGTPGVLVLRVAVC